MSDNDFMRRQQDAVERMREMSRQAVESSAQPMPPTPPFVRLQSRGNQAQSQGSSASRQEAVQARPQTSPASNEDPLPHTRKGGLSSLPFLDMLNIDGDLPLIIGLLLILFSEKADKKLLFAQIYILL